MRQTGERGEGVRDVVVEGGHVEEEGEEGRREGGEEVRKEGEGMRGKEIAGVA